MPAAKKAAAKKAAAATSATAAKAPARKTATVKATAKRPSTRSAKTASKAVAKKDTTPVKKDDASSATGDTAGSKPAFDAKFLEAQRQLLLEERATYKRQADTLQAEADSLAELREPGDVQFDEESGEGDTLAVERERDLALSARARQEIEEIDRALEKITAGTYGICEVSGEPIPRARLQAIPQARERVEYKVGGFGRR
jgi:RNA polymerase-binding transcription factor DksA